MQIVFVYLSQWAHESNYQKCEMFSSQKKKEKKKKKKKRERERKRRFT